MTVTELEPDPRLLIGPVFDDAYSLFSDQSPATRPYEMYVTGEGTSFENADAVTTVIETFLTDLQYIDIDGYGARQVQLNVWVTADNDRMLARAENDLMRQLYKPTLLWWRPPRSDAPWSVFEVATSELKIAPLGDNDFEEATYWRKYTILLTCGAWVRGMTEEVATMPSGATEEFVLNSGTDDGVSAVELLRASVGFNDSSGDLVATLTNTTTSGSHRACILFSGFAIDPTVTPTLVVEGDDVSIPSGAGYSGSVQAWGTGGVTAYLTLSSSVATPDGWRRYYALPVIAGVTWESVQFNHTWNGHVVLVFEYQRLLVVDAPASIGSMRQKMFELDVKGSVVARGAIEVGNEDPVGSALIYSFFDPTDGLYMPVLTPWRSATFSTSSWAVNADMASGHLNQATATQQSVYLIPLDTLPDGTYDIVFKGRSNGASAVATIKVEVYVDNAVATTLPLLKPTIYDNAGKPTFYTVGQVTLPLLRTPAGGSSALLVVRVMNEAPSANTFQWDDVYLLNIDIGAYTILKDLGAPSDAPSPAAPNFVSLESPSFEWPAQSVMVGARDEPETLYTPPGAKFHSIGRHELEPGRNRVLVVTDALDSEATARYYPRGHTNMEW